AEHGEVVGDQRHLAAVDARESSHLAVRRRARADFGPVRGGEHARLAEAAWVDQIVDALARVQEPFGFAPGELVRTAHGERLVAPPCELLQYFLECHRAPVLLPCFALRRALGARAESR